MFAREGVTMKRKFVVALSAGVVALATVVVLVLVTSGESGTPAQVAAPVPASSTPSASSSNPTTPAAVSTPPSVAPENPSPAISVPKTSTSKPRVASLVPRTAQPVEHPTVQQLAKQPVVEAPKPSDKPATPVEPELVDSVTVTADTSYNTLIVRVKNNGESTKPAVISMSAPLVSSDGKCDGGCTTRSLRPGDQVTYVFKWNNQDMSVTATLGKASRTVQVYSEVWGPNE